MDREEITLGVLGAALVLCAAGALAAASQLEAVQAAWYAIVNWIY
jgi:hypothetical protein